MVKFSSTWKASKRPSKQRNYRRNAPLHLKKRMLRAHLSKALREKHKCRTFQPKVGDKVRVMRGGFAGKEGLVKEIDTKRLRLAVSGVELTKPDGTKVFPMLDPSNIMIIELKLEDKHRKRAIERRQNGKKTP
jgi:large subunit ribosomal protein L24